MIYTNIIGAGFIATWGTAFWNYFDSKPVMRNEGWFGKDTKYGGADKLGHLYSTSLWSLGWRKTSKILNYYQLPYTYVTFGYDFDSESSIALYSRPYYGDRK